MRYNCIKCLSETDNDDDVCDTCKAEAEEEYRLGLEWQEKQRWEEEARKEQREMEEHFRKHPHG